MNHFPFHIGDYIKSTVHLSNEEDLTYWRLICHYYDTERPIGKETQTVSKRLRLDNQTVCRILAEFFFEQDDGWHNKRCDEEITWYQQKCARNRDVGKLGGRPRKTQVVSRKKRLETDRNPNQNQNQNQNQEKLLGGAPPEPPLSVASAPAAESHSGNAKGNGKEKPTPPTRETWAAYKAAYLQRHGADPVSNAKVNSQIKQFVERIGQDESPGVAAFFVGSNRGLYVSAKHPVNLLLRDAESLRTEWATNRHGTETEGRQADKTAAIGNVFTKLIEESREAKKNGA